VREIAIIDFFEYHYLDCRCHFVPDQKNGLKGAKIYLWFTYEVYWDFRDEGSGI